MKIRFSIGYQTQWGESLRLLLYSSVLSEGIFQIYSMDYKDKSEWNVEIEIDKVDVVSYRYALVQEDETLSFEYGGLRAVRLDSSNTSVIIRDNWRKSSGESPFSTAAFADCFFKRNEIAEISQLCGNLIIQINCTQIEPNRHLAIVGNQDVLGNWDVQKKLRLEESLFPIWRMALDADKIIYPLEYKYLLVDSQTDEVLAWDGGANRVIESAHSQHVTYVNDESFLRPIPSWKCAGVAIPVFSLRSKNGFGVGEFLDLKKAVDWAKKTGQRIIQTLPINDTILYHTNADSYPYNAVSVYALHPIYLNLDAIGRLKSKKQIDYFKTKKQELNDQTFCDYQNVMTAKWEYFKVIYPQESPPIFASDDYLAFFETNQEWLVPYAAFSYLRDLNGSPLFGNWPQYSVYNQEEIQELSSPNSSHFQKIAIYYFLQYHLHKQLVEVHDYARVNGIAIKGDIPIGVSPRSVDAWVEPELFNFNSQAGAPPDDFSTTGQNWGFPTYNWDRMEKDGYQWWRKRFQKLSEYFDAYRIDHILGFFRIWGIPADAVWGLNGSFQPALPYSREELELEGLQWDENRFLKPFLKEHVVYAVFEKYTDEVIREYFVPDGFQNFQFKPEFDTQKKIEKHFSSLIHKLGNKDLLIRDGLYMLHSELIFVRDIDAADRFHPRISMHTTASFRNLPDGTRQLLDKIYVDYFYHRHSEFWKQQAFKKLPALISATNMLVCGEDLGMVPDCVPEVMQSLEILSLEIQRMPKKPNTEFAIPSDAPYMSVCSTSTHDLNPIRAWWEEDPDLTQRFYNQALGMEGQAPAICETWVAERIVEQHLSSNAMLIILPWQDWIALDSKLWLEQPTAERINVPSNPNNFWCYRMHMTLEKLLTETKFNNKISKLISKSGR